MLNKQAFSFIEVILCLVIICSLISINSNFKYSSQNDLNTLITYLNLAKSIAITENKTVEIVLSKNEITINQQILHLNHNCQNYQFSFNKFGYVKHAKCLNCGNKKLCIELGGGVIEVK